MDLSSAEKTLKKLEENGSKVEQLAESVVQFQKLQEEIKLLPDHIQKQVADPISDFEKLQKELKSFPTKLTVCRNFFSFIRHFF